MNILRIFLIVCFIVPLAGCQLEDELADLKSDFQAFASKVDASLVDVSRRLENLTVDVNEIKGWATPLREGCDSKSYTDAVDFNVKFGLKRPVPSPEVLEMHRIKEGEVEGQYEKFNGVHADLNMRHAYPHIMNGETVHWRVPEIESYTGRKRSFQEISVWMTLAEGGDAIDFVLLVDGMRVTGSALLTGGFSRYIEGVRLNFSGSCKSANIETDSAHFQRQRSRVAEFIYFGDEDGE